MKYKVTAIIKGQDHIEYIDADSFTSDENGDFFFYRKIGYSLFGNKEEAVFIINHKYIVTIELII